MDHRITLCTHRGLVRQGNEDAVWASGMAAAGQPRQALTGRLPATGGAVLLADGMGGHAGGELASHLAIEVLRTELAGPLSPAAITAAVNQANDGLFMAMKMNPDLAGMGTTIVGMIFHGDQATLFNVGDSRAYLHTMRGLVQLSEDHVEDGHVLTKCIGGFWPEAVEPFTAVHTLDTPCRFLLCSDGLTDMLNDDEIRTILDRHEEQAAIMLIEASLEAGGHDNVSAIVIDIT